MAIEHPNSEEMSDNKIAKHCGVSQPLVSSLRGESYNGYVFPPLVGKTKKSPPTFQTTPRSRISTTDSKRKDEPSPIQGIDGGTPKDAVGKVYLPCVVAKMRDLPRIMTAIASITCVCCESLRPLIIAS